MKQIEQKTNFDIELHLTTVAAWDNGMEHDVLTQESARTLRDATDLIEDTGTRNSVQALLGLMEAHCNKLDSYMTVALVERFLEKIKTKYGVVFHFTFIDVTERELMTGRTC